MLNVTKLIVLTLLSGWMLLSSAQASEGYGHQKVVYHINYDNAKKQSSTLRNIQNHINAVGADNLEIKVVLHGNGLSYC